MNQPHLPSPPYEEKWQRMLAIVNQHPALLQPMLAREFKKLSVNRFLAANILVFLLQYTGLMFSTLISHPTPLWFASGTACAFIFMRGCSILPGIWLGSFCAYYFSNSGGLLAFSCATIHMLQAFFLLWLSYRYINLTLHFYDRRTCVKFILCSAALTAIASLFLTLICYSSLQSTQTLLLLWRQWWLANFNGLVIFACALITLDTYFPQIDKLKQLNLFMLKFIYGLLFILICALLFCRDPLDTIWLALSIMLLTFIISIGYGWCGVIAAVFLSGLLYGVAASLGAPIFNTDFSSATVFFLQLLLCVETMMGLFIAIASSQTRRMSSRA